MFEIIPNETFDARERRMLQFWRENKIFERSVADRERKPLFSTYDGPPFATGLPHYGHLLAGTIKDVVLRFKTMEGYYVPRRFGWDCHGLPIENEVEKSHNLSGAASIEAFGIANFNEACRSIVKRYTQEWKYTVERTGRWVDFTQTWHTMDLPFMESVWWVFKQLYDQGLVYEGYRVMPYSAKLGTPLSNFEAGENYKDVDDPAITVALVLEEDPQTSLLVWTTTPWTMISNLAVMVGPDIDYVKVYDPKADHHYIVAVSRVADTFHGHEDYKIVGQYKGSELAGKRYKPAFSYFADRAKLGAFRVILEPTVTLDDGTGLVQCAPAFGEVDFYACQREKIELVCPVDANGQFTNEIPEHQGLFVKDADKDVIKRLKQQGSLFRQATIHHRYPFCWRSDTPLIYKAMATWFVAVEKIKDKLLAANEQIYWVPSHLKEGRFGKWLESARDWNISRNRYWGTPIPLWRSEEGDIIAIGSLEELEKLTGHKADDLHRHFIDDLTIQKDGKTYRRIPEVFDCWFESGSMPYGQGHYPFENKESFDQNFPADFIAEGLDQTRGWFYTLTILAAALYNKPAFKNIIVNGIILAEDGAKMSKRLRNYPDPLEVISKYGADSVRLYMMHSPAVRAENLCFVESGVELTLRQMLIPWWNAYSFLSTYARINKWVPSTGDRSPPKPAAVIDRWILAKLNLLIRQVREGMDNYVLSDAVEPLVGFIDSLTNWYIRRSRRRFWEAEDTPDRAEAFATLYYVLVQLSKVAAPFTPFIAEAIFNSLRTDAMSESVHLCDYPTPDATFDDEELVKTMDAVQSAVNLGHSLRKEHKLKVRQPLPGVHIATHHADLLAALEHHTSLIADELNVKAVHLIGDDSKLVELSIKPNFRVLGKKVGKLMRQVQQAIEKLDQHALETILEGKSIQLHIEGETIEVTPEDAEITRKVHEGLIASTNGIVTVALDTHLTEELIQEGIAREIVNKINTMRREAGFDVTDRIQVVMDTTPKIQVSFEKYKEYITNEVLATEVKFGSASEGTSWEINDEKTVISVVKHK
ncbi:MAG: isoleucine--tRNA ligase [Parachlamydiales bacterium]|jgi:isoleucyl-tRNA synthetase